MAMMIWYCRPSTTGAFPLSNSVSSFAGISNNNNTHFLIQNHPSSYSTKKSKPGSLVCLSHEFTQIAHNKVLVAAGVSAAIGQLSKPFTSALLYKNDLDLDLKKWVLGAGGFPSVHSAGVVAAATSLALERGFSDSVFGVAVVFAAIVMYDAQGVRRQVGNHAKVLNKMDLINNSNTNLISGENKDDLVSNSSGTSYSEENVNSLAPLLSVSEKSSKTPNGNTFLRSETVTTSSSSGSSSGRVSSRDENQVSSGGVVDQSYSVNLKESIGHTEIEVIAGAFLGFFVSLALYSIS